MFTGYSGATGVIFIVGDPIAQVKSPQGTTTALRARGADLVVVPAHVAPTDLPPWLAAVKTMRNAHGVIVTVPHKVAAAAHCERRTDRALNIGAVNVLRPLADGGWLGDMLDGLGFVTALTRAGCELSGRSSLLVGAGGAGAAIAHALCLNPIASLVIADHDARKAEQLVAQLHRARPDCRASIRTSAETLEGRFDLAINATPMGMRDGDPLPFDPARVAVGGWVGDVVTAPAVPPLIAAARAAGCRTVTGSDMFAAVSELMVDFFLERA